MRGKVARKIHRAAAKMVGIYDRILPGMPRRKAKDEAQMAHRPYRRICRVLKREHMKGVAKW
jgi:hypothetical protein